MIYPAPELSDRPLPKRGNALLTQWKMGGSNSSGGLLVLRHKVLE